MTGTEALLEQHFEKSFFNAIVSFGIRLNPFIGGQSKFSIFISVSWFGAGHILHTIPEIIQLN